MDEYKKLQVYEKSYKLVVEMYKLTQTFPKEEKYAIISQIQRAATSIPLNIAEGYAKRESQTEFKRFLMMAVGSIAETNVLLDLSRDLEYISETDYQRMKKAYEEVGKMLNSLKNQVMRHI